MISNNSAIVFVDQHIQIASLYHFNVGEGYFNVGLGVSPHIRFSENQPSPQITEHAISTEGSALF